MENILAKRPPVALRIILMICAWMSAAFVLILEFSQNFLQILYSVTGDLHFGTTTPLYWLNGLVYCAAFIVFAIFVTVYCTKMKGRTLFAIFFALFAGILLFGLTLNFFEYIAYGYMPDLYSIISIIDLLLRNARAVLAIVCMILVFRKKKVLSLSIAFSAVGALSYSYSFINLVFADIEWTRLDMTYGDIYTYIVAQNALSTASNLSAFPMLIALIIISVFFDRAEQKPAAIETGSFLEENE